MEFGLQFFPSVSPEQVSGAQYFEDSLKIVELGEELGFTHARIVEHYFHPYGGYSPSPLLFLAAASQRTARMRLMTGAVLPVFNHPLKLAAEIGMLDAISNGRVEVGFARAFLPHEYARFGVPLDESRARFNEGLEAVRLLLEETGVAFEGRFHRFPATTSLPRPTQRPRPPFWIAALASDESFANAGRLGHGLMAIPLGGAEMARLIEVYRSAWRAAGHPGRGRVMLAFHMYCHADGTYAADVARAPMNRFLHSLVEAAEDWTTGLASSDYPDYGRLFKKLADHTFESSVAQGAAWVGTPATIAAQIREYSERVGGFDYASVQGNFNDLPYALVEPSMRLFAREVMPLFAPRPGV